MDQYDIAYARDHLIELIERAARGEDVSIKDPAHGTFKLTHAPPPSDDTHFPARPVLGQWKGRLIVPEWLLEPLSGEELAWLSGEHSE